MTIIEKNGIDSPWLFRTQPLQTDQTKPTREVPIELVPAPTPVPTLIHSHSMTQHEQQQQQLQRQQQQRQYQQPYQIPTTAVYTQQMEHPRPRIPSGPIPMDPKKVLKSSTAPNLRTSNSLSGMFRVI
jgi:hypothetical protein